MWFIGHEQTETGPYTDTELRQLVNEGTLKPGDQIRPSDASVYVKASTLQWLFPEVTEAEQPMLVPDRDADHILGDDMARTEALGPLSMRGIKVRPDLTLTLGDFQILQKVGAGGMGAVYLAHQRSKDRRVAIKMLASHLSGNLAYVHRFYREALVLSQLQHPNIVRFYGVGEEKNIPFFAMEYINGQSTARLLSQLGRFSIGDALHIVMRCAEALAHGHSHNIIHRDIKPGNILITRARIVKITDLGLAKPIGEDMTVTETGVSMGTPKYMAPEQYVNAKHADHRSDIYALGAVLYHFLAGDVPFKGETSGELQKAKDNAVFAPARRLNPEIPTRLDLLIGKMLAKDPRYRYQSCKELLCDIEGLGLHSRRLSFDQDMLHNESGDVPDTSIRPSLVEILLIHEDGADIRLAQQALEENHIAANLNVVKDGLEAINFLSREGAFASAPRPHLIILGADLEAPASLAALDELKRQPQLASIPLVILTRSSGTVDFLKTRGFDTNLTVSNADDLAQFDHLMDSVKGLCLTVVQRSDATG